MKKIIIMIALFGLNMQLSEASMYRYSDYVKMRNEFDKYISSINTEIEKANKKYIISLNSYQKCSSNSWRAVFTTVIPEINERRMALDEYKRDAYNRAGKQNYELYKIVKENSISKVQKNDDLSEFVLWYKTHISFMKAGPLHELQVYSDGYQKLTKIYETMAISCLNNPKKALNYDLASSGIKGLLDGVFSLIGKLK